MNESILEVNFALVEQGLRTRISEFYADGSAGTEFTVLRQ